MLRRIVFAVPLALVSAALGCAALGCGAAPPPAAATSPEPTMAPSATATEGRSDAATKPAAAAAEAPRPQGDSGPAPSSPAPGRAGVATDAPIVTTITQNDVLALVQKNAESFNRCYTLGAGASKSYRAKVTVKATVGPTGVVNGVEVTSSTSKNPRVDACVVDAFKKLTFARPKGSGTTTFTFPLSFDGLEQVQ